MKTLFFIFLFAWNFALAAEAPLGSSWPLVLDRVQARGLQKIGDFAIADFRRQAANVRWHENGELPPEEITGNRRSAFYRANSKDVYVTARRKDFSADEWAQLELHEVMGASGLMDDDYSLSTSLMMIATLPDGPPYRALVKELANGVFRKRRFAGGSSVSGGGDINALIVKRAVFARLQADPTQLGPDLLEEFPSVRFEPLYVKEATIAMRFTLSKTGSFITIFVPMNRWGDPNSHRAAMVEEISMRLLEIFPPLARRELETGIPKGCGFKDVTLEADGFRDISMATLRATREWYRRGCQKIGEVTRTWGSGGIPFGGSPEEAAHDFMKCDIAIGSFVKEREITLSRPVGYSSSSWSEELPSGQNIRETIVVSSNGFPSELRIVDEKTKDLKANLSFSKDAPFIAEGSLGSQPVRGECRLVDPRERVDHGSTKASGRD